MYEVHENLFSNIHQELLRYDALLLQIQNGKVRAIEEMHESLARLAPGLAELHRYNLQHEVVIINDLRLSELDRANRLLWQIVILMVLLIGGFSLLYVRKYYHKNEAKKLTGEKDWMLDLLGGSSIGISIKNSEGESVFQNSAMAKFDQPELKKISTVDKGYNLYSYHDGTYALGEDIYQPSGVVEIRADVSLRQKAFHAIELALQNQKNAAEAKADFLATMSHEMRTPLNGVLGLLGLLLDGKMEPEQRGYALTARESGEVLLSLIEDILDYSKIEAGKLEFEDTKFSIADLVGGVCDILAPKTFEKNIEISWHVDSSVPKIVRGDPGRLRQILLNLAGNAVKFTERGGVTVEMTLAADHDDEFILSGQVNDTGIGIPFEAQDSMFGEFNQLDASYSRRFGGSGLGLAITRRLVEAMGGSIRVSSEPGQGSSFSFSVQLSKGESEDHQKSCEIIKRSILFWGMEGLNTSLSVHSLRTNGHKVTFTETENELMSFALKETFDVIFLDGKPSDETVFTVVNKLDDGGINIPIYLLLASRNPEREKALLDAKTIRGTLQKPVHEKALENILLYLDEPDKALSIPTEQDDYKTIGQGYRLLLVEDSSTNRMVASVVLRRAGFRVDWVVDGAEAVEAVQKLPYDIVLMDISMPVMDGVEATKIIRSLPGQESQVPIISLTAHAMPGDRERFLDAGMNNSLTKPLDVKLMLEVIKLYLPELKSQSLLTHEREKNHIRQAALRNGSIETNKNSGEALGKEFLEYPILDMGIIDQMREDTGDESIPMLIDVFKEEVPMRVSNIVSTLKHQSLDMLGREAHTLKSTSGSFGAMQLNSLAKSIELAAKNNRRDRLETLVSDLENVAADTLSAYEGLIN